MLNFVALISEEEKDKLHEDSESGDDEIDPKLEYRKLYDHWVSLSNENLKLLKDKALLEAQINILEMESLTEKSSSASLKGKGIQLEMTEEKRIGELESKVTRLT